MRCVLVLCAALLVACSEQPADHLADALADDPVRLKALRAQCLEPHGIVGQGIGKVVCGLLAASDQQRGTQDKDASHGGLLSVTVEVHALRRVRRAFAQEAPPHFASALRGRRLPRQFQ